MTFENKDIVAWFGALLSSVLAFYTIKTKIGRLGFSFDTEWVKNLSTNLEEPYVVSTIVNLSERPIILKKIITERFVTKKNTSPQNETQQYSHKLTLGEEYKHRVAVSSGNVAILTFDLKQLKDPTLRPDERYLTTRVYYPSKIRLKVIDTTGKVYRSKWIDLEAIKVKEDADIITW